jgi:hypothetical protein
MNPIQPVKMYSFILLYIHVHWMRSIVHTVQLALQNNLGLLSGLPPLGDTVTVSINTQPLRNGPAGSEDCEHGTKTELFALAPTTYH